MRTDKGFMLAEEMLSWLHNNNVIFPSVEVIERTLAEVVTLANRSVFSTLTAQLEKQHKSALDSLLISGVVSENGIYGHSRFCNTDFDDKLACLNLSGV